MNSTTFISWLISLCIIQFLVIVSLISKHHNPAINHCTTPVTSDQNAIRSKRSFFSTDVAVVPSSNESFGIESSITSSQTDAAIGVAATNEIAEPISGVAATLMLHAPTWFQRRYTLMIQNVVNNIPADWKVQIFYTKLGQSQKGLDINPGISKFIASGKVVLSEIPEQVLQYKKKRFEMMVEPWIWQSMLADKVLIFGGNAVICSNSPQQIDNFTYFDYIGAPWDYKSGIGGDGGISIRSRTAMLAALNFRLDALSDEEKKTAHRSWGQEDTFFVSTLLTMQQQGLFQGKLRLAAREDTLRFAAIGSAVNDAVFAVSGTLPVLSFEQRAAFMNLCPEMKVFYPALHDPSCFGAKPDGEKCAKTVCALKPRTERRGGC